ncbi:MAG: glycosyltransferase family 2 protein [Bacteroidales bacterium]
MQRQPRFSIITITYNAEKTLEPTIRSILEQDYPNIEYIIIDGASKDGTLKLIDRFRDRIAKVVSEPDKGLYDAMNKGLQHATGDYVWFINAGDALHSPFTVRRITEKIGDTMPDIIYGETALVNQERTFIGMRRLKAPAKLTYKSFRHGMLVCHQSFIAKRALAEPYDLKYRFSADFDWCVRCMKKASVLYNSKLILTDYLSEGLTTANRKASLKERFAIMRKYYGLPTVTAMHAWFLLRALISKLQGETY